MLPKRLSPDKLLARIKKEEQQEKRGKLKIYLGAAPGVGKTYTMLQDALSQRARGLDVIVGVVESHGRQEVQSLLKDFDIIPLQTIHYRDKELKEFDLDMALKRAPGLILVDEMAHTNAPGLRHEKRWQDIKELLDRGINVYTTLNVQHIESLIDDVAQIIHAPIKETIPDSMLELADSIELVDLAPEDLLKRLQEGKIYIPAQATLAAEHFFRKGNLIALRELALRTTAERVNAQVLSYRQDLGIKHIWPSREKILVCVGPGLESVKLIRAAKRMATNLQAIWFAVYVEPVTTTLLTEKRNLAIEKLRLAEQLGATTRILNGPDVVTEIMRFAHEENITLIMVLKHASTWWRDFIFRSLADDIMRHSGEIDVYIMTAARQKTPREKKAIMINKIPWSLYALGAFTIVLTTGLSVLLVPFMHSGTEAIIYLCVLTLLAFWLGPGPLIFSALLSILAYDFFFVLPFYNLTIENIDYIFISIVLLLIPVITNRQIILRKRQTEISHQIEYHTSALYTLSRQLASMRGSDKLLHTGVNYIATISDSDVLALFPKNRRLIVQAKSRASEILNEKEQGVAEWVFELGQTAGLGTDTLPFVDAIYLPIQGTKSILGVLRVKPLKKDRFISPEETRLLEACANQIAIALEVERLGKK